MKRKIIKKLIEWKDQPNRKPLILKGVRQVGKTFILKQFGRDFFPNSFYLNFEEDEKLKLFFEKDLSPTRIINELKFHFQKEINTKRDLIIFDEIQECPKALTSLKYFNENMPELALCSAGSLLGIHLEPVSFPVGKVNFLNMYPMTFEEFLVALEENLSIDLLNSLTLNSTIPESAHSTLWERLKWYFIVGGLPEVVSIFCEYKANLFEACEKVRTKQHELTLGYFADMVKHSGKANAMHLERVWNAVPNQLAQTQDGSARRFKFKGVIPQVNRYSQLIHVIDWLKAAGLIIPVHTCNRGEIPFKAFAKENAFKLFNFDVGMLGAISDLPPGSLLKYDFGSYKGYFAENFVAQEFLASGTQNLYSWHEKSAKVEFLREIDGEVIPIEVKSGWVTKAKSIKVFQEKYNSPYQVVLSAHNLNIQQRKHMYPLYLAGKFPL